MYTTRIDYFLIDDSSHDAILISDHTPLIMKLHFTDLDMDVASKHPLAIK